MQILFVTIDYVCNSLFILYQLGRALKKEHLLPLPVCTGIQGLTYICFSRPGVHAADRISGKRLATLPHVLQTMGRPFGIIAIPSECRKGKFNLNLNEFILQLNNTQVVL